MSSVVEMSDVEADFVNVSPADLRVLQSAVINGTKIGIVGINNDQITTFVEWMKTATQTIKSENNQTIPWQIFNDSIYQEEYSCLQGVNSISVEAECEKFFDSLKRSNVNAIVISVSNELNFEDKLVILFAQKYDLPFIIVTTGMMINEHGDFEKFKETFFQSQDQLELDGKIFHITPSMSKKKNIKLLQNIFEMTSNPFFSYLKQLLKRLYNNIINFIYKKPSLSSEAIKELIERSIQKKQQLEEIEAGKKRLEALEDKKIKLASTKVIKVQQPKNYPPPLDTAKDELQSIEVDVDEDEEKYKQELKEIEEEAQRIKERAEEMEKRDAEEKLRREQAIQQRKEKMQFSKELIEKEVASQVVNSPILQNAIQQFRQDSLSDDHERLEHVKAVIAQSTAIKLPSTSISRQIALDHEYGMPNIAMPNIQMSSPKIENVIIQDHGKPNIGVIGLPASGRKTFIGALAGGIWPDKITTNPTSASNYDIYKMYYPNEGIIARSIDENKAIYEEYFVTMQMKNLAILIVTVYGALRDNDYFIISLAQKYSIPVVIARTKLDEWLDNTHQSKEDYIQADKKFILDSLKKEKIKNMDDKIFNISALSYNTAAEDGPNTPMAKYLQDEPLLEQFMKTYGIDWHKSSEWEFLEKN